LECRALDGSCVVSIGCHKLMRLRSLVLCEAECWGHSCQRMLLKRRCGRTHIDHSGSETYTGCVSTHARAYKKQNACAVRAEKNHELCLCVMYSSRRPNLQVEPLRSTACTCKHSLQSQFSCNSLQTRQRTCIDLCMHRVRSTHTQSLCLSLGLIL
jgi:hypothetical protein